MKQALNIAILGCRGIPNRYGGFEQLAQHLSEGLVQMGYTVTVYNSHRHPYKPDSWHGVKIIHCYDAEHWMGTAGQFVYDFNCIRNARKHSFDVILFLGYTSSSVWGNFFPGKAVIISNMDGLEWKRAKYSKPVQWFLQKAEKLAVTFSNYLIADSPVIAAYLKNKYGRDVAFISYGAEVFENENTGCFTGFDIGANGYFFLMARMEPENNIEMILDGYCHSGSAKKFIVTGNTKNKYGRKLQKKYSGNKQIVFTGAIFDPVILHTLKKYSCIYFHGHSAGGTNPSLLEAMASGALVACHNNEFNKAVVKENGLYFVSSAEVRDIINRWENKKPEDVISKNLEIIRQNHNWENITRQYGAFITQCYRQHVLQK